MPDVSGTAGDGNGPVRKAAKLLRLICDRSIDGETLAAASRLSALATAYNLDWDRLLLGDGADLTREQLQKVYQAGFTAGLEAQHARDDWRNAGVARTDEVGEREAELRDLLAAAEPAIRAGRLDGWFVQFVGDMAERLDHWGSATFVSERQWECLDKLRRILQRGGFL